MTDREFGKYMSAIAQGDRESLRAVYDEYLKLIFAVVYDTIRQREEAEDVTSEFFIKLYRIADSYKKGTGHKRWLVTIAKNMAIDRIRKIDREMLVDEMPERNEGKTMESQIVENLTLKQAVATLKPEEQEILDLKVVGGFTFKEIADMKERPIGTITWIYNQAIQKLRRCRL